MAIAAAGPRGFEPAYHRGGGTIRASEYLINDTNAIYTGDMVILETDGYIDVSVGTDGTPSTNNVGVFFGVKYTTDGGEFIFRKAWPSGGVSNATDIRAYVYDDPNIVFTIQSDQVATELTQADVGSLYDWTDGTPSTTNGQSGGFIDSSVAEQQTDGQLLILGPATVDQKFTAAGTAMYVYVSINEHIHRSLIGI